MQFHKFFNRYCLINLKNPLKTWNIQVLLVVLVMFSARKTV